MHAALEQLYGLPAEQRGPQTVDALVGPAWEQVLAADPELTEQLDADQQTHLLDEARKLLSGYYSLEDPTRFDPQSCEQRIEVELADGTLLRGIIDRIDVAPTGELRVVDYKTGKAPPEARALAEFKAMFQMKFYAVALLRSRGVLPTRLRLIYLSDGQLLDYSPDEAELLRFEKTLMAIWHAIQSAGATGDFRPRPSRLCDWCAHHSHCPVFGGTPPPYPGWPHAPDDGNPDARAAARRGAGRLTGYSSGESLLQHRRDQLADRRVNVHGAGQGGVRRLGRHHIQDARGWPRRHRRPGWPRRGSAGSRHRRRLS